MLLYKGVIKINYLKKLYYVALLLPIKVISFLKINYLISYIYLSAEYYILLNLFFIHKLQLLLNIFLLLANYESYVTINYI